MEKRTPEIKWRKSDEDKLNRAIRRFNSKIEREMKKHPENADILPEKIKKKEVKEQVQYRNDFNKLLKSTERFMKKDATKVIKNKEGVQTTKWEKKEIAIKVATINRERTRERKLAEMIPTTSQGKETGLKRGEMGDTRTNELKPKQFDFNKIKSKKEWQMFIDSVDKQVSTTYKLHKMELFKENYIKALKIALPAYADEIIEVLKDIPAPTVVNTFYGEQEASIDFIYDPQEAEVIGEILLQLWQDIADDIDG
jgi:hypothetical protein